MNEDIKKYIDNMPVVKNYRGVINQFIVEGSNYILFQSYSSPIAMITADEQVYIFENWNASKTTGKYRNLFLNETKKETEAKIKSGEYILIEK